MAKELKVRLIGDSRQLEKVFSDVQKKAETFGGKLENVGDKLSSAGKKLTVGLTLPLAAAGTAAFKMASDWESAFAGVRKTVNATEAEFAGLAKGLRNMSKEIPVGTTELARLAETAGQLGIKNANILGFTRVVADLGVTTNLAGEEAATALARIANITGLAQDKFSNLGSSIVALGNNLATTEAEIVEFGLRIAGAGEIAGLNEAQILAIGAAMSSVGVEAEAGGTAVQKVLLGMTEATAAGDERLKVFARTAGMSSREFSKAWKADAAGAFTAFVEGLGKQGQGAFQTLEQLGMTDQRLIRSFLSLSGAGDLLARSMSISNKAFSENNALSEEAGKRYDTTQSKITIMRNKLNDAAITLGNQLLPIGLQLLSFLNDWIAKFQALSPETQDIIIKVALLAAAIGPVLFVAGKLIAVIRGVGAALAFVAANPVVLIIAGIVALIAAIVWMIKNWDKVKEVVGNVWDWVKDKTTLAVNWVIGKINKFIDALNVVIRAIDKLPGINLPEIGRLSPVQREGVAFGSGIGARAGGMAEGGTVARAGWSWVGERGPELLNLNRGATVVPLDKMGMGIHVTINAGTVVGTNGMQELASMIRQELLRLKRGNGTLGLA